MKYYLLFVWHDVDPRLIGPFNNTAVRDAQALVWFKDEGPEHGYFMLNVGEKSVEVHSYSGAFFSDFNDAEEISPSMI